jgi:hypothetical protein
VISAPTDIRPPELPSHEGARLAVIAAAAVAATSGALAGGNFGLVGAAVGVGLAGSALFGTKLLEWRTLVLVVLAIVLFVPSRRIVLAVQLPFDPEPYRLFVATVFVLWLVALLVDPAVRLRHTPFDWPLGLLFAAILLSEATNPGLINLYGQQVVKSLSLILSFLLLYYFVTSVFTTRADVEFLVKALVAGTTVVAIAALVERATGFNVFSLERHVPGLAFVADVSQSVATERDGAVRVLASAEHPIALGALFALVTPLSIYLGSRRRLWLMSSVALVLAASATVSRTPVLMLVAVAAVFFLLQRGATMRLLPLVPIAVAFVYLAAPNVIEPTVSAFFPSGGLLAEQSTNVNEGGSGTAGRLADLRPALEDVEKRPIFGFGYGTRVIDTNQSAGYLPDGRYAGVLDDQWLGSLLDLGIVGVLALVWLFTSSYRRLACVSRARGAADAWLAAALAASAVSFAVGMVFFDAFAFTQVTIVFFFVLALAGVFLRTLDPGARPAIVAAPAGAARLAWRRRYALSLRER